MPRTLFYCDHHPIPLPPGHKLWHMDNVLLTPHIGGAGSKGSVGKIGPFLTLR